MFQEMFARFNRILVPFFAVCSFSSPCLAQTLPAGQACPDFGINIDVIPPKNRVEKNFYDKNGNLVRLLYAGKGNEFVFTNLNTNFKLTVKTGGSVENQTPNPDGTTTWITTGHELIVMFPTDTPPGPATTLYIGRLVFTSDAYNNFFIRSFTGNSVDICAALAGNFQSRR